MKNAFIYSEAYFDFDYGPTHPLKIIRLKLAYELIRAYGLLKLPSVQFVPTIKAGEEDLARFHRQEYLDALKEASDGRLHGSSISHGLGPGDNPVFPGLFDWSLWATGGTLQAADFVSEGRGEVAFNIAGGLHHAHESRASGFCYINDPAIGILRLLDQGKRVLYLDIDAHHGDGVQKAFYHTDRVMTISFHESGTTLFPGSGFETEIGEGAGEGYSVNVPFPPYTGDEMYCWAFEEVVPPLVHGFMPDVVVTELGVDTFYSDPLTNLHLTIMGYEKILRRVKTLCRHWVALGGGGYDISNVARAWTLAWAIMNGVELEEELPESYLAKAAKVGLRERRLREGPELPVSKHRGKMEEEVKRVVAYIKETIFPKVI